MEAQEYYRGSKDLLHSKAWFEEQFKGVFVSEGIKEATRRICLAYNIKGLADPGYIANTINQHCGSL